MWPGPAHGTKDTRRSAVPPAFVVAVALALGIAAAQWVPGATDGAGTAVLWSGVAGAAVMGVLACLTGVDAGRWTCLAGAAFCAGVSLGVSDLRGGLEGAQEGPMTVIGVVASAPRQTATGADVMARHSYGIAGMVFELHATGVECAGAGGHTERHSEGSPVDRPGSATLNQVRAVRASLFVRVQDVGELPPRGTLVRLTGWYRPPGRAMNPGGRAPGSDGSLTVPRLALVQPVHDEGNTLGQSVRQRADDALTRCFPAWAPDAWRALVKAMTTGVRDPALVIPGAQFRMAGMSHILAISGFNVAVLVGVGSAIAGMMGAGITARAMAALATSLLFLLVTEPEVSVLRAGLGAGLAALAGLRGGRSRGLGTLGAVAAVTLLLEPSSIFGAGFQLSYGVVIGLLTLTNGPSERWGERAVRAWRALAPAKWAHSEVARVGVTMFAGAWVSSVVAFTVSTPIALWHGGFVSTYAAPIAVFTMPAAALVTIGGVAAIAVDLVWSAAAVVPGAVACGCAGFLATVAELAAELPGTCWWTGRPSFWWVLITIPVVSAAWVARSALTRRAAWGGLVLLSLLVWTDAARPHGGVPAAGVLRVEALDVGNGACTLVRAGEACVLVDAGTSSDDSAGSRRIVPALAALGVRRLDTLVITCAQLERFSAVPEVVRAFGVRRVILPRTMAEPPSARRETAAAFLRTWLEAEGCQLETCDAGTELRAGDIAIHFWWPQAQPRVPLERPEDAGLVVRVHHAEATAPRAAAVFTGGLTARGCRGLTELMRERPLLFPPPAVMDLPARGAWSDEATALLHRCAPRVVLQSTGQGRLRKDRWREGLPPETARGITALHGALRVEIGADASTTMWNWEGAGWSPQYRRPGAGAS